MTIPCMLCCRVLGQLAPNDIFGLRDYRDDQPGPSLRMRNHEQREDLMEFCSIRCGHSFHRSCVNQWLICTGGQRLCPECAKPFHTLDNILNLDFTDLETRPQWSINMAPNNSSSEIYESYKKMLATYNAITPEMVSRGIYTARLTEMVSQSLLPFSENNDDSLFRNRRMPVSPLPPRAGPSTGSQSGSAALSKLLELEPLSDTSESDLSDSDISMSEYTDSSSSELPDLFDMSMANIQMPLSANIEVAVPSDIPLLGSLTINLPISATLNLPGTPPINLPGSSTIQISEHSLDELTYSESEFSDLDID